MDKIYFFSDYRHWLTEQLSQYKSVYDVRIGGVIASENIPVILIEEHEAIILKLKYHPDILLFKAYEGHIWIKINTNEHRLPRILNELRPSINE